ncbi:BON domain-containing protein [Umezakia ovalisporum]|jgi:osmotically-inducible protein OsmY|uniref:BON domain-containing protein n=2 Tax=Umezakia ovalisporum TaxID=75695 RepID=A0AA43H2Z9_9CYAN|nr:BON domain-containing protein [Umezakia ovalisporum]MBI1243310.1 BON domain-containing protein [Nostoc sp. RI_552]MDH6058269.1 BON domain-containing protein [Umezakia ovalisporum FSS-43]MDH6065661.1 BON domain-containing protein [Umezakia ovalisporum FSS-62]MDH6068555.1 BON domain-containing protein [Umezakia ovalisporum APH033B]MDH6071358.1 BON domain-containing protein [Umezakia ovalisporum CobakiLakeA]
MSVAADEELQTKIIDKLHWDDRVNSANIGVTVNDAKVTLRGTVPSYRAKTIVEEDTREIKGITEVINHLQVQYPSTTAVPIDEEIASNVANALTWDSDIDANKIDVSVVGGLLTLRGIVDAYWKKFQVEDIAYGITGVIDIINELAVVPTKIPEDEEIARSIENALERNTFVEAEDVNVVVENGRVTLTGFVPNWSAWRAAHNTASYTKGVVKVVDGLAIRYLEEQEFFT